jgi:hypothetical protein
LVQKYSESIGNKAPVQMAGEGFLNVRTSMVNKDIINVLVTGVGRWRGGG